MPTPIAHSMTGIIIGLLKEKKDALTFFGLIMLANLPDLDLFPVLFYGKKGFFLFHRSITHSLGFGMLVWLLLLVFFLLVKNKHWLKESLIFSSPVFLHILLDMFCFDPLGYYALWPFSMQPFHGLLPIFPGMSLPLLQWYNLNVLLTEGLSVIPIVLVIYIFMKHRHPSNAENG